MESLRRVDAKSCWQWAVELLLYTSTLPLRIGQLKSWAAGSGNLATLCPSALGQRVVALLLHRVTLLGANRQQNSFQTALMCLGEARSRFFAAHSLLS